MKTTNALSSTFANGIEVVQDVGNNSENIEAFILTIRGKQVLLDRDLAMLYNVETKVLNQAIKRNQERFPERFRFQLTKEEMAELVTNCDRFSLLKHSSVCPFALTEQGVAMLSTVLRSATAVETSIKIMDAFVTMRHFLGDNIQLFRRLETIEYHQLEMKHRQDKTENRIDEIFNRLNKGDIPKQGIFFDGQIYDAYTFVANLIRDAKSSIVLIDNYIDDTVLTLLDKRNNDVTASIYTDRISRNLQLDINRHNAQYPPISIGIYRKAHDRFLIVDSKIYHIGASIKDLGKKIFGFSLMKDLDVMDLLNKIGVDSYSYMNENTNR
ncbi:MAG: ORF6N domain-containing protein [Bacteroides sp.]|nr:ORF6N domain-containing protein [Bacteroides sp.]